MSWSEDDPLWDDSLPLLERREPSVPLLDCRDPLPCCELLLDEEDDRCELPSSLVVLPS
jgi:hypothetical protein